MLTCIENNDNKRKASLIAWDQSNIFCKKPAKSRLYSCHWTLSWYRIFSSVWLLSSFFVDYFSTEGKKMQRKYAFKSIYIARLGYKCIWHYYGSIWYRALVDIKKITLHPGIPSFTHISQDVSYIRQLSGRVYPQAECNGSQARDLIKKILVCGEKGTWAGSILRRYCARIDTCYACFILWVLMNALKFKSISHHYTRIVHICGHSQYSDWVTKYWY